MSSRIGSGVRRRLDRGGAKSREKQQAQSEPQPIPIGPPWGGYAPDLSSELTDWRYAAESQALVQVGGVLRAPPGFARLHTATLPLGDATPPAAAGDEQPVVGLWAHRDPATTPVSLRRYAVTADETLGHLYESQSGVWVNIPYTGAGAGLSGDPSSSGVAGTLADFTSYSTDNAVVFTNGFDVVYRHVAGGANYTDFSPATLAPFKAKSVCTAAERLFFLNTSEGGTGFPYRVRYTTTGGTPALSGLGAGPLDVEGIAGEGVAIRPLGAAIIAYFRKGSLILRPTGDVFSPFRRDPLLTERGLLGTFAVCPVAKGQHFGVFDDGWYFVYDDGRFEQVGLLNTQLGLFPKWRKTFYDTLNTEQAGRVFAQFDRRFQFIWVLWVSNLANHPDRLWVYDIETDTVWPVESIFPNIPNVLGLFTSVGATETYDTIGTVYENEMRTYLDMFGKLGSDILVTGDRVGVVMQQFPSTWTVDGVAPNYLWKSPPKNIGRTDLLHTWDRLNLRYRRLVEPGGAISVELLADDQVEGSTLAQQSGGPGEVVDYVTTRLTGAVLAYRLSGQHPVELTHLHGEVQNLGWKVLRS